MSKICSNISHPLIALINTDSFYGSNFILSGSET
ncbi:uncharacterized protein METZ01_LOCUS405474 [marine metagenome]|uniref:Uncharacterized protein n=1 Tax=marine metagenome TaxID=408172 RepID=A0A382W1X8_9ZZZZ